MKQYQLQPTEVVLYETDYVNVAGLKGFTSLTLTNLNFVFETTRKKSLFTSYTTTECLSVDTVKIYNEVPQIKQKFNEVKIYFTNMERTLTFNSRGEAHKFTAKVLELLTGKNAFFRGIENAKKTVDAVDETLGIDTIGVAATVAKTAVSVTPSGTFQKTKAIVKMANGLIKQRETKQITETSSTKNNLETLRTLKMLLDEGAITQEEFDKKKKELLAL